MENKYDVRTAVQDSWVLNELVLAGYQFDLY